MRGDPHVELRGAVLVGRKVVADAPSDDQDAELVTVTGLLVRIGPLGLTVEGYGRGADHTVRWQRVRSVDAGGEARFPDGAPARSIEVELNDRTVRFLVPPAGFNDDQVRLVKEIVRKYAGDAAVVDTALVDVVDEEPVPESAVVDEVQSPLVLEPMVEQDLRRELEQELVGIAPERSPTNVVLPPPPPQSSRIKMPPRPFRVDLSQSAQDAPVAPGGSHALPLMDRALLVPRAVPEARRVEAPVTDNDGTIPDFEGMGLPGETHTPPALPPPPPLGSSSRLPPPVAGSPGIEAPVNGPPVIGPLVIEAPVVEAPVVEAPVVEAPVVEAPVIGPLVIEPQLDFPKPPNRLPARDIEPPRIAEPPSAPAQTPTHRRQRRRRSRNLSMIGGGIVLVLAIAGGAVFGLAATDNGKTSGPTTSTPPGVATRSGQGGTPGTLVGPAPAVDARTVAGAVNLVVADLPAGWVAGKAPWGRVATAQANHALAGCLGLPAKEIGILTGNSQSSGQLVQTSGWVNSSKSEFSGFESSVALKDSVDAEVTDLSTFASVSAASCLQGWFASLDVAGDQIIVAPRLIAIPVLVIAGERGVGFRVTIVTRQGQTQATVEEDLIVIGAGKVEATVIGMAVGASIDTAVEASVLKGVEQRLQVVARS